MNFTKRLALFCLAAALAFTTACAAPAPQGGEPTTLVYGSGDYTAINPALYEHGEINLLLFSGLTAHDSANKVVPALAERWEYDAATFTYTFHLRQHVLWHDGKPFTSADVLFTLETIQNPANASEIASNYEDITALSAPDEHTVLLSLKAPNVAMLDYLTIGILPRHLLEGKDLATDTFNQQPIGTGPYKLSAWDAGQSIVLEKNPDYYAGAPKIDRVIFKIVPDAKARALQLKSGELDLAQVTPRDAAQLGELAVYRMSTSDYRGILYNFNHTLFLSHRELPAALSYAIDRQAIVEGVLLGGGEAAYSPLQRSPYNNPDAERYAYSPEKARALLEQAGWKTGADEIYEKDGTRLAFTIHCSEGDQVRVDMASVCAQQLRAVGADVKVAVDAQIDWAGQESYLIGWGSPFDPDDHTYKVFGSGKGSNFSGYANPVVDELLQRARESDVEAERLDLYRQFQAELARDPAYTFIAYVDAVYAAKKNLHGITPNTVLGHHGVGIFWNVADWTMD